MVANCAGLELPGTETGEPFGSPTQPAINRECDCANDMKKTRARLISLRKHPGFQSRRQILLTREEYSPGGQKLSMGKNFLLSRMYKIKSIEPKTLSAKLKKIPIKSSS